MLTLDRLDEIQGSISNSEGKFLADLSSQTDGAAVVEVGSWRGKSAVAMAIGAQSQAEEKRPIIHCVDPHTNFEGVYGGKFGPHDRKAYFENVLAAGFAEQVALINLTSSQASQVWRGDVGLLFVDGDHTLEGVTRDFEAWNRHINVGGIVAFDDAIDESVGPYHLIRKILSTGQFIQTGAEGKIVALTKL